MTLRPRSKRRHALLVAIAASGLVLLTGCVGERSEQGDDDTSTTADTSGGDTTQGDTAGGDTGGDTAAEDTDAGDDTGADTGGDDTSPGDTVADTGGEDTAPDVVETGTVSLALTAVGSPLVGASVASHRADGSVLDDDVTDTRGEAQLDMEAGGMVTVDGSSIFGERILISVTGVQPGDTLAFSDVAETSPAYLGDQQMLIDSANWPQFSYFTLSNGCNSTSVSPAQLASLPLYDDCVPTGRTNSGLNFAWGHDANGALVGWGLVDDVPVGAQSRMTSFGTSLAQVPIEVTSIPGSVRGSGLEADFDLDGVSIELVPAAMQFEVAAGVPVSSGRLLVPDDLERPIDYTLTLHQGESTIQLLEVNSELVVSSVHIDAALDLLPAFTSASVDMSGAAPVVSWVAPAEMSRADAVLQMLVWPSPSGERRWAVISPPVSDGRVSFPQLPDSLRDKGPQVGVMPDVLMMAADASFVHDYAAVRAAPILPFSELDERQGEYTVTRSMFNLFK